MLAKKCLRLPSASARGFHFTAVSRHNQTLRNTLRSQLSEIEAAGTYKRERVIVSPQSTEIDIRPANRPSERQHVINMCANNYLGLADNKRIIEVAKRAMDTHGFGLASVRFICGTQDIHKELERKLAEFHGTEDAILYGSCFDANAGVFHALLDENDAVISDELNHASIIDGVRLAKTQKLRYRHMDMADLEDKLRELTDKGTRIKLIVTDGVFSMDGDIAPLDKIRKLADQYDASIMIDECHATGFMGRTGRGTDEHCGVFGKIEVINSTLGKALGGATGGYTASTKEVIDVLRQRSRPYLFSNSVAPSIVAAGLETLKIITESTELRDRLEDNMKYFRKRIVEAGFEVRGKDHPIVPIMIGDAAKATKMADDLLKEGIYAIGFSYPVVAKGLARIRVQLSASHTRKEIDTAIAAFIKIGKQHGVIH